MSHTVINPTDLYDPVALGYSHLAAAGNLIFVAGQYASDRQGRVTARDFATQVEHSLENLRTALCAVGLDLADVVQVRTFVVGHDRDRSATLADQFRRRWGDRPPARTMLGVTALALPEVLFEIDAVAVRS